MCSGSKFFEGARLDALENIEQPLMHALDAYFYSRSFRKSIFAIKAQRAPSVDVVNDGFILSLLRIGKFHHPHSTTSAVEAVQELSFHLLPIINGFGLQVSVPIEGVSSKRTNELLCEQVSIRASIIARLDKVGDMLLRVPFPVELLKLWRLIAWRHP
jgi:hypothetical protein